MCEVEAVAENNVLFIALILMF